MIFNYFMLNKVCIQNFQLWQAFAGVKKRRVENYYQSLLAADGLGKDIELQDEKSSSADPLAAVEKWKGQIEKVSNYIILLWTPVGVGSFFSSGCLFQYRIYPGHFQGILP